MSICRTPAAGRRSTQTPYGEDLDHQLTKLVTILPTYLALCLVRVLARGVVGWDGEGGCDLAVSHSTNTTATMLAITNRVAGPAKAQIRSELSQQLSI